jgi:hypothetical protein
MVQLILIGLSAGAAAALLFASVASGSLLSVPLFYLAPLPILIAALGWSHWAALIAAVVASGALAVIFSGFFFLAFFVGIGLPAWWLGYLALLARPVAGASPALEWYPAGFLVFWAAIIAGAIVIAGLLSLGTDLDSIRNTLRSGIERMLNIQARQPAGPAIPGSLPSEPGRLADILTVILPPAAAVLATLTNIINLWLAERVVKISGRLARPPSDLSALQFPSYAPALTAAAVAASFAPGIAGVSAEVLSASLLMAYAILGFAVLHAITRGTAGRPFALGGAYAAAIVFGWPVVVMSLLGLADTVFDFRGRAARRRGPSDPNN